MLLSSYYAEQNGFNICHPALHIDTTYYFTVISALLLCFPSVAETTIFPA